jgi:hypothetical protein
MDKSRDTETLDTRHRTKSNKTENITWKTKRNEQHDPTKNNN